MPVDHPNHLALKAREIARESGAEAIVIISLHPAGDGKGWTANHAAYLEKWGDLDWVALASVVRDAADSIEIDKPIEVPEPS